MFTVGSGRKRRAAGGEFAKLGQFPHMAAIGIKDVSGKFQLRCVGSVINRWYVLTAAHCVYNVSQHVAPIK